MKINLINNNDIDRDKWDATIDYSNIASPCLRTWYLDKMFPNWEALVNEDYSMIFPIINSNDKKYFFPYGGIISTGLVYSEDLNLFIDALPSHAKETKLNPTNWWLKPDKTSRITTHQLSLEQTHELIHKNFAKEIAELQSDGRILELKSIEAILKFVREALKIETEEDEELLLRISNVIKFSISRNNGIAIAHIDKKNQVSSLVLFLFNQNFIHLFLSLSLDKKNKNQLYQIIYEFIKENDMSSTILDMPNCETKFNQITPKLIGSYHINYQLLGDKK
ncbi:MAG: hypothetical protein N4A37_03425 [Prolixibacteraceae bacterium]|jgi:hypothetical protein|nr:hypothetical protein [Prolixibacteraceae bacterium]